MTSKSGAFLSFLGRAFLLFFIIERIMAFNSFDKFKITGYESRITFEEGAYTTDDLNFESNKLDFMIGFDRLVPTEVGRFDFSILTFGTDREIIGLDSIESK